MRLYGAFKYKHAVFNVNHQSSTLTMSCQLARRLFQRRLTTKTRALWRTPRVHFSSSSCRPFMELTGFTEEQLTVRDAVSQICTRFPNTYWQDCDQNERDPKEFHAALAQDGWLGIALPEEFGGAGLGIYYHLVTLFNHIYLHGS